MKSTLGSRRRDFIPPALEITSMMDMFTIIVFFLLFAYSEKPQEIHLKENVDLPYSSSIKDYKDSVKVVIGESNILIDEEVVGVINKKSIQGLSEDKPKASLLYNKLREIKREKEKQIQLKNPDKDIDEIRQEFSNVIFFCDKKVPYSIIKTVMKVSGMAGFPNFQLAIMNEG